MASTGKRNFLHATVQFREDQAIAKLIKLSLPAVQIYMKLTGDVLMSKLSFASLGGLGTLGKDFINQSLLDVSDKYRTKIGRDHAGI